MKKLGYLRFIWLVVGIVLLGTVSAWAATHTVVPGESIQDAIAAAAAGDIIQLGAGVHSVAVTIDVDKSVTIEGLGAAIVQGTTIDARNVFKITANDVAIQNLDITLTSTYTLGGELEDCLIGIPTSAGLSGIVISGNTLYWPAQAGAMSGWGGRAIVVGNSGSTDITITGNTVYNIRNGIVVRRGITATVTDNVVYDTKGGIMQYTTNQADADNRTMTGNTWGTTHNEWDIVWNSASYDPDYQASVMDLSDANDGAYVVDRRNFDSTNPATGNRSHIFVNPAGTLGVGTNTDEDAGSMNEPLAKISMGVDWIAPGGTIYVQPGVYVENVDINRSLDLLGQDGAILDGTGIGETGLNVDSGNVTVDNIEVRNYTNGVLVYTGSDFVTDWTGLVMSNNTIHSALGGGGGGTGFGLYIGTESERFHLPIPPWGMAPLTHLLDFTGLEVRGNEIYDTVGAALVLQSITSHADPLLVVGNNVHDSANSALWIDSSSNIMVTGNDFRDSAAGVEISAYSDGWYEGTPNTLFDSRDIQILYNVITGNSSSWGAGVVVYDAWPSTIDVNFNVITGNSAYGVWNWVGGGDIDASLNWWGDVDGPSGEGLGAGDSVSTNVIFSPWLGTNLDGNVGAVGVQVTAPVLIIVAPVGPEPAGGYLNTAIAGSNELPFADTIEVRHGTYDASEPITAPVNIASETGSALHTTLNGNMSINGDGVLIGLPLQGFRINGDVTVGAGANAATSRINWSDLYGYMTNNGIGTFDAQYNYWGTKEPTVIGGRTTGLIDYDPYLPRNADDSYVDVVVLINAGVATSIDLAIEKLWAMDRLGQDVTTFIEYQSVAGAGAFQATVPMGQIDLGGDAGGGGAVGGSMSGTFTGGDVIEDSFTLTDPLTGDPITDAAVTLSLLGPDGDNALVFWGAAVYDEATGEYVFSIDTTGMAPGTYELTIQADDGQLKTIVIVIEEP